MPYCRTLGSFFYYIYLCLWMDFHLFYDDRKTSIALVCNETEEGRVEAMSSFASNIYVSKKLGFVRSVMFCSYN